MGEGWPAGRGEVREGRPAGRAATAETIITRLFFLFGKIEKGQRGVARSAEMMSKSVRFGLSRLDSRIGETKCRDAVGKIDRI